MENLSVTGPVTVPSKPGTLVDKGKQSLRKKVGLGTSVETNASNLALNFLQRLLCSKVSQIEMLIQI